MIPRWLIRGMFTTATPMHVGSGAIIEHPRIIDQNKEKCDVAAVATDYQGHPCIPGSSLKGVLRAWAELFFPHEMAAIDRIFGHRAIAAPLAEAGWAEFPAAVIRMPAQADLDGVGKFVPYWQPDRCTGILSNVCISRKTGAAQTNKLFYQEFVPEGSLFDVAIAATRLTENEIALLLAILEQGNDHPTHPYQFGANGSDGWGRVEWSLSFVKRCSAVPGAGSASVTVGFGCCQTQWTPSDPQTLSAASAPAHLAAELTLAFQGPFLVNDASRAKTRDEIEEGEEDEAMEGDEDAVEGVGAKKDTNFKPLRRATGDAWLPSSSFRGAVRQRAEFLLRSLNENVTGDPNGPTGDGPIERIFGQSSLAARLKIAEFTEVGDRLVGRQDFVAIDRFTGGAADRAKFDAEYADKPTFKTTLVLDLDGLKRMDVALLALALRDVCQGKVTFGFGAGKGYGRARGELGPLSGSVPAEWNVPASALNGTLDAAMVNWLNDSLGLLPSPTVDSPVGPATVRATAPATSTSPPPAPPPVLRQGTLGWQGTGSGRRRILRVPNQALPLQIHRPNEQLAFPLRQDQGDNISVEYELEKGQPVRIRPAGQQWAAGPIAAAGDVAAAAPGAGRFIHPYYFLALADRTKFQGALADKGPIGHERLRPGLYTGTIRVRLTTKTPLLVCDDESANVDGGHKTYSMRTDNGQPDGKPLVMSSSVRGMLRSAYEAITNSRFGVFPSRPGKGHTRRLGHRMPAVEGLSAVPVLIESGMARLMLGDNPDLPYFDAKTNRWIVPFARLHAAWVQRYKADDGVAPWAVKIGGRLPKHGEPAWCWLEKIQHSSPNFSFWAVREIAADAASLSPKAPVASAGGGKYRSLGANLKVEGRLFVSNQNIKNKHDERFFFGPADLLPIDQSVEANYLDLIRDYQSIHAQEIKDRRREGQRPDAYLGFEPGKTAWSRHVYVREASSLDDGTLCYARVDETGGSRRVVALYPVMISRKIYEKSPAELLPGSLRPATSIEKLSPADRVFGWASQDAAPDDREPAYRGHVRVGQVTCTTEGAVETFSQPEGLAILGQPKPAQGRFYLGQANGAAQSKGLTKERAGYGGANRIRGPKVFPHHREFSETGWVTDERSKQNRSITGWVKPRTTFELDLDVENLPRIELGALVWLLSLPADHFLRMGLGKPLGFGSVRAEIVPTETRIADGADWAAHIRTWDSPPPDSCDLDAMKVEFESAINAANPTLLRSFKRAAEGFADYPVHYPRLRIQKAGSGEQYKWFVENEKQQQIPLPDLSAEDPSLPLL